MGAQLFEGISDTLRILMDVSGSIDHAQLVQLQKELELTVNSPPATSISAVWQILDRLVKSTAKVEDNFITNHENQAAWWAIHWLNNCRSALDELTFLVPWIILPKSFRTLRITFTDNDEIPTLRELAKLGTKNCACLLSNNFPPDMTKKENEPFDEIRQLIIEAGKRANKRIAKITSSCKTINRTF